VQHRLIVVRQLLQRGKEECPLVLLEARLDRVRHEHGTLRVQKAVHLLRFGRLAAAFFQCDSLRAVPGDGIEPAGKPAGIFQLGQRPEGQHERLLRHVLGRLAVAQHLPRHHEDGAPKSEDEGVEGSRVAEQHTDDQLLVATG